MLNVAGKGIHTYMRVLKLVGVLMVVFGCMLVCYRRSAKRANTVEIKTQVEDAVN